MVGEPPKYRSFSHKIISALSEERGEDPEVMYPLYDTGIDTTCIEGLLENSQGKMEICFNYLGDEVYVNSDGCVEVNGEEFEGKITGQG